jgi:phospholipase C
LTRRGFIRAACGAAAVGAVGAYGRLLGRPAAGRVRAPDSLPDPTRPAGEATAALPLDHIVIVMQENHSFDNYFGMPPRPGQPRADGFTRDRTGTPVNSNRYRSGIARVLRAPTLLLLACECLLRRQPVV